MAQAAGMTTGAPGEHTEHENDDWSVRIPDHPERTESAAFRHAKDVAHKIVEGVGDLLAILAGAAR